MKSKRTYDSFINALPESQDWDYFHKDYIRRVFLKFVKDFGADEVIFEENKYLKMKQKSRDFLQLTLDFQKKKYLLLGCDFVDMKTHKGIHKFIKALGWC